MVKLYGHRGLAVDHASAEDVPPMSSEPETHFLKSLGLLKFQGPRTDGVAAFSNCKVQNHKLERNRNIAAGIKSVFPSFQDRSVFGTLRRTEMLIGTLAPKHVACAQSLESAKHLSGFEFVSKYDSSKFFAGAREGTSYPTYDLSAVSLAFKRCKEKSGVKSPHV